MKNKYSEELMLRMFRKSFDCDDNYISYILDTIIEKKDLIENPNGNVITVFDLNNYKSYRGSEISLRDGNWVYNLFEISKEPIVLIPRNEYFELDACMIYTAHEDDGTGKINIYTSNYLKMLHPYTTDLIKMHEIVHAIHTSLVKNDELMVDKIAIEYFLEWLIDEYLVYTPEENDYLYNDIIKLASYAINDLANMLNGYIIHKAEIDEIIKEFISKFDSMRNQYKAESKKILDKVKILESSDDVSQINARIKQLKEFSDQEYLKYLCPVQTKNHTRI